MRLKSLITRIIPSFIIGNKLLQKFEDLQKHIQELDYKNEYLFWTTQKLLNETTLETKKRVFLNMPEASGQLRKIQLSNLDLLNKIKEVCDRNNIHYFLLSGTLLGSVRHKGFIPWDDDIDIGMLYSDYLKFKDIVLKDDLIRTDIYYCYRPNGVYNVIKVKFKDNDNFFVDVFLYDVFDSVNNEDNLKSKLYQASIEFNDKLKNTMNSYYDVLTYMAIPETNKALDNEYFAIRNSIYEKYGFRGKGDIIAECVENYTVNRNYIYAVNDVFPLEESEFEGSQYYVWKNFDEYLSNTYGDIWNLPRSVRAHHLNEIV